MGKEKSNAAAAPYFLDCNLPCCPPEGPYSCIFFDWPTSSMNDKWSLGKDAMKERQAAAVAAAAEMMTSSVTTARVGIPIPSYLLSSNCPLKKSQQVWRKKIKDGSIISNSSHSCIFYLKKNIEILGKESRGVPMPQSLSRAPLPNTFFLNSISAWIQTPFFLGKWTIMIAPIWWTAFGKAGRCLTCRQNFHGGRRNVQRAKGMHHSLVP